MRCSSATSSPKTAGSLQMLGTRAVRVLADALNRNNAKVAMELLKQLEVFERRE